MRRTCRTGSRTVWRGRFWPAEAAQVILSAPHKIVNGIPQSRVCDEKRRGMDPLAAARRVLQNSPALTFEQLSWPTGAQMNGDDGGVYLASAQLFVSGLLALKNGPAKVRALLARLPACENWQAAFFAAFREDFPPAARRGKMVGAPRR